MHNNLYGTSIRAVQNVAAAGKCCILDIDVQGARQVRKQSNQIRAIFVFLKPPSLEELEKRLRGRGTETEEQIRTRLATSKTEIDRQVQRSRLLLIFTAISLESVSLVLYRQFVQRHPSSACLLQLE